MINFVPFCIEKIFIYQEQENIKNAKEKRWNAKVCCKDIKHEAVRQKIGDDNQI